MPALARYLIAAALFAAPLAACIESTADDESATAQTVAIPDCGGCNAAYLMCMNNAHEDCTAYAKDYQLCMYGDHSDPDPGEWRDGRVDECINMRTYCLGDADCPNESPPPWRPPPAPGGPSNQTVPSHH